MSGPGADQEEFVAKLRHMNAETEKFVAEQRKLIAEQGKMLAETLKLGREHWWTPVLATTGLIGGLIAAATLVLHALGKA